MSVTSRPDLSRCPDLDSRERIEQFARDFYRRVAMDDLLGPVFAAVPVDWAAHIRKLTDFWAKQLLGASGYEGNPLRAHAPVAAHTPFRPEHYERWLGLFTSTVDEHLAGPYAELAKRRAWRMARALERLLAGSDAPEATPIELPFTRVARRDRMVRTGGTL
jgi:hemoglobin